MLNMFGPADAPQVSKLNAETAPRMIALGRLAVDVCGCHQSARSSPLTFRIPFKGRPKPFFVFAQTSLREFTESFETSKWLI